MPPRCSDELKADFFRSPSEQIRCADPVKVVCSWRELPTCQLWLRRAQTWSGPGEAEKGGLFFCVRETD